jgi:hypothetical protein
LVVIENPATTGPALPTIYAWNGTDFKEASRDFPEYYAGWAAPYVKEIRNSEPMPASALSTDCELLVRAFDYAGQALLGRQSCLEARKRVLSGWAVIPGQQGATPQDFDREKSAAADSINRTLARLSKPENAKVSGP